MGEPEHGRLNSLSLTVDVMHPPPSHTPRANRPDPATRAAVVESSPTDRSTAAAAAPSPAPPPPPPPDNLGDGPRANGAGRDSGRGAKRRADGPSARTRAARASRSPLEKD